MSLKVDPKSPVLWVRVRGLDGFRSFVLSEVAPKTPMDPDPHEWRLLTLHDDANDKVLPVPLTVDAARTKLAAGSLRLYGSFAPGNDAPMVVDFMFPKDAVGHALPSPALTVQLKNDDDYLATADVALETP